MKTTRPNIILAVLVVVFVVILVPFQVVRADSGHKPSMHFEFAYEVDPAPTIVSGVQSECQTADCSDAEPLGAIGAQGFRCELTECSSVAYGYSDYHRLSIDSSDGRTRQSNVFGKKYYEAYYRVTVREQDLLVEELPGKNNSPISFFTFLVLLYGTILFCVIAIVEIPLLFILLNLIIRDTDFPAARGWYIAGWVVSAVWLVLSLFIEWGLAITVVVEIILALAYALWRKRPRTKLLTVVLMMNLITQPTLWLIVSKLIANSTFWPLAIGEVIVWLVEAGILVLSLRKQAKFPEALALSLALNLASFGIGLLLPF
ncbi:MAG: hypothetical protein MUO77_08075 [Anaerolineales bacterium]|nr:hypothetical protein [Anaerolineales bacterium]